jgi:hypothetical protein
VPVANYDGLFKIPKFIFNLSITGKTLCLPDQQAQIWRLLMRKNSTKKRLDPMIVVALIGLVGTIIAALLASPLIENWGSPQPTVPVSPFSQTNTIDLIGNNIRAPSRRFISGNLSV